MLLLLSEGRAVLLTEEATEAGVTSTTILLDGSSVCAAGLEDIPPGAGTASLVSRIPSVRSAEDRKQQPFSLTALQNPRNSLKI